MGRHRPVLALPDAGAVDLAPEALKRSQSAMDQAGRRPVLRVHHRWQVSGVLVGVNHALCRGVGDTAIRAMPYAWRHWRHRQYRCQRDSDASVALARSAGLTRFGQWDVVVE